jgi:hypothetical protein
VVADSPECLDHWTFEFGYCLEFGYWDLGFLACDGGSELLQSCWVIINFDVSLSFATDFLTLYAIPAIMHTSKKTSKTVDLCDAEAPV